jgi:hypothetical protein
MIKYQLRCERSHEFEAWFRNSGAYDEQSDQGLLSCPACGSGKVGKALMAPSVGRTREVAAGPAPASPADPRTQAMAVQTSMMRKHLLELRAKVEESCDYVGPRFAEEARKIHYGEVEAHGIYGETTNVEREALNAEGITCSAIPWVEKDHA